MTRFLKLSYLSSMVLLSFLFHSCNDSDPVPVNEEEEITSIEIIITETGTANSFSVKWADLDGDGGNPPTVSPAAGIALDANTDYSVELRALNENSSVDLMSEEYNITLEIEEEDDEHEFFYEVLNGLNLQVSKTDQDANTCPVGIEASFSAGAVSSGDLRVTLKHQPGLKSCATGSETGIDDGDTDIEVTLPVNIQ